MRLMYSHVHWTYMLFRDEERRFAQRDSLALDTFRRERIVVGDARHGRGETALFVSK